jgi:uncharacterized protein (TIGR03437 family)
MGRTPVDGLKRNLFQGNDAPSRYVYLDVKTYNLRHHLLIDIFAFKLLMMLGVAAMSNGIPAFAQSVVESEHPGSDLQRARAAQKARRALGANQSATLVRARTAGVFAPRASFDTSGNSTLKGAYFVRQILTLVDGTTSAITRAVGLVGTMTFDGNGNYSFTGQELDSAKGSTPSSFNASGTYAVSASGLVQIQNPIDNTDTEFGGVGGSNEIVASATEGQYDDIFVAIPAGSGSGVQGSYQVGFIDFLQGNASNVRDGYFTLASNGSGSFGNVTVNGAMANQGNTNTAQSLAGVSYSFNGSNGTITFPTASNPASALVSGSKNFAVSPDGNIVLGGSPNGFDLFVGFKSASSVSNGTFTGTYFTGALENDASGFCGQSNCIDSFAGSAAANGQGAGTQHSRLVGFDFPAYDYTSDLAYSFPSSGTYNDGFYQWILGTNGQGLLRVGTGNFYTLVVGFQAKQFSGTGVFLNPDGIVNSASFAPITNSVAPGEYVTLFGSGLASNEQAPSLPLSISLGSAQVSVNGSSAPLLVAGPTLVNALVPNATPVNSFATFQVTGTASSSSQVTVYTASTAPGVFTSTANGIGPADVFHSNFTYVTQNSPAVAGETLIFYATGLGATTPVVADGVAAPSPAATVNDSNLSVDIFDSSGNAITATIGFAGLAPGLAGVYQINFTVPPGLASGIGYLDLGTTDGYTSEAKIYIK